MFTKHTALVTSTEEKLVFLLSSCYCSALCLSYSLPLWSVFATVKEGSLSCQLFTQRVLFCRLSLEWNLPSPSTNMDSCFLCAPLHRLLGCLVSSCSQITSASLSHTSVTLSHNLYLDSILNKINLWYSKSKVKIWTWILYYNSKLDTNFLTFCEHSKNAF